MITNLFKKGDKKSVKHEVVASDFASFPTGKVHSVYSTYALTRDAEWCTRQFVLDMKEVGEEGIGTFVEVQHKSPALLGEEVEFIGMVEEINGHELICSFEAKVNDRIIANGRTGQKILKKEKLDALLKGIKDG